MKLSEATSLVESLFPSTAVVEIVKPQAKAPVDHTPKETSVSSALHTAIRTGGCEHPIRLTGKIEVTDARNNDVVYQFSTERDTDHDAVYVPCKTRRASRCESCAKIYQNDAFQLITGGLRAGDFFDESITQHPALFVTFTAPSFGPVHSAHKDGSKCRPRRNGDKCPHDKDLTCWSTHSNDETCVGQAICSECFEYEAAAIWNASSGKLWRATVVRMERELAKLLEISVKDMRKSVCRMRFVKIAEGQRRGLIHFHAAVRLDGPDKAKADISSLLTEANVEKITSKKIAKLVRDLVKIDKHDVALLATAITFAAQSTKSKGPSKESIEWGQVGFDIKVIGDHVSREELAGYFAKYATKGADARGVLNNRIRNENQISQLPVNNHHALLIRASWKLANQAKLQDKQRTPRRSTIGGLVSIIKHDDKWILTITGGLAMNKRYRVRRTFDSREKAFAFLRKLEQHPNALRELNLDKWAHQFGFRGHFLTKSRDAQTQSHHWPGWSTTFAALRQRRADYSAEIQKASWQALSPQAHLVIESRFEYAGSGYRTPREAHFAAVIRGSAVKEEAA